MTQGVVMFAMGNDIKYVDIAAWNARRIHDHLGLPTTLITDQQVHHSVFDHIINIENIPTDVQRHFPDINHRVRWNNLHRCDSLDLSPYDRTLLLDTDYVVCGDDLKKVMDHGADLMCFRYAYDVATGEDLHGLNHYGTHRMPMWWATVVVFSSNRYVRGIFDSWRMIRDNWQHYLDLYHIKDQLYRNDTALSIALGIVSGHSLQVDSIPWKLATVLPNTNFVMDDHRSSEFAIFYLDSKGKPKKQSMPLHRDVHVMAKSQLEKIVANAA